MDTTSPPPAPAPPPQQPGAATGALTPKSPYKSAEAGQAYPWERTWRPFRGNTIRRLAGNQAILDRLLHELQVPPAAVEATEHAKVKAALDRFFTDVNLNIAYYERRMKWRRLFYCLQAGFVLTCATGAIALAVHYAGDGMSLTASGVGLVVVAAVSWLQFVTGLVDFKGQWAAFWKASSELKEQLYTFQQAWRGRAWEWDATAGAWTFAGGFEAALWQEVLNARKRVLVEREAFFGTFKSAGDLVSGLQSILGGVRGDATAAAAVRAAASAPSAQEAKLAELRARHIEAAATLTADRARLADLEKTGTPALIAAARDEVSKAESEVVRVEALLTAYARSGVFNR